MHYHVHVIPTTNSTSWQACGLSPLEVSRVLVPLANEQQMLQTHAVAFTDFCNGKENKCFKKNTDMLVTIFYCTSFWKKWVIFANAFGNGFQVSKRHSENRHMYLLSYMYFLVGISHMYTYFIRTRNCLPLELMVFFSSSYINCTITTTTKYFTYTWRRFTNMLGQL